MDNQTVQTIKSVATQTRQQSAGNLALADALDIAVAIAETGWQTDQSTIEQGIAARLPDEVAAQTAVLNGQIADLLQKLTNEKEGRAQDAKDAATALKAEQDANQATITNLTDTKDRAITAAQDTTQPDDTTRLTNVLNVLTAQG